MKKLFTTLTFLLLTFCTVEILQAQVTIGSAEPPIEGALLDLKQEGSTRGGLGLPRVALSDMSQLTMGTNAIPNTDNAWQEHTGLIVYNTATDINICLFPGVFLWDGTQWNQLSGANDAAGSYATDVAALTAFRDANTSNTLGWTGADPKLWNGTTWQSICGEVRLVQLSVSYRGIDKNTGLSDLNTLTILDCSGTNLTSLDLSKNTALTALFCHSTNLTSLDLSKNTALTSLECPNNQMLTSLDVSKNTALTNLDCSDCSLLTSLDVSKNTALTALSCAGTSLASLDLSKNTALTFLRCKETNLTSLNLSKNTALTYVECGWSPQLASLVVSGANALTELECGVSQLTSLDVSKNTALTRLQCRGNKLTSLDVSKNIALTSLDCEYNYMEQAALNQIATDASNMGKCSDYAYWQMNSQYKPNTTEGNSAVSKPSCP